MRHAEGGSAVRSAAKHRSDSAARSTPTRSAAKGHAQKSKQLSFLFWIMGSSKHFAFIFNIFFLLGSGLAFFCSIICFQGCTFIKLYGS
ncbi:MAG: hypothetical protein NZ455_11495 [Bacteroidia bacterium]|nr:hypothetical protein [Bacteroidia bacterium]